MKVEPRRREERVNVQRLYETIQDGREDHRTRTKIGMGIRISEETIHNQGLKVSPSKVMERLDVSATVKRGSSVPTALSRIKFCAKNGLIRPVLSITSQKR